METVKILGEKGEGWLVEIKSKEVTTKGIAKAMGGLANRQGGILIVGLREIGAKDSEQLFKTQVMTKEESEEIKERGADAAQKHNQPEIKYKTKVVAEGEMRAVIFLIEEGRQGPHINLDGRIYERVDNTTRPLCDTRRLDTLLENKRQKEEREVAMLKRQESDYQKAEVAYMRLIIRDPDVWQNIKTGVDNEGRLENWARLLNEKGTWGPEATKWEKVQTRGLGVKAATKMEAGVIRIPPHGEERMVEATVEIDPFLERFDFTLPMSQGAHGEEYRHLVPDTERWDKWNRIRTAQGLRGHRVLDLTELSNALMLCTRLYTGVQNTKEITGKRRCEWRACLNHWNRKAIFIAEDHALEQYEKYGVPSIEEEQVLVPSGNFEDKWLQMQILEQDAHTKINDEVFFALQIATQVELFVRLQTGTEVTTKSMLESVATQAERKEPGTEIRKK